MKKIPLYGKHGLGKFALVDDEDYEVLNQHRWYAGLSITRTTAIGGVLYARRTIHGVKKGKTVHMHREILGVTDRKTLVDHIDLNGLNNQKSNLRLCTQSTNQMNRRKSPGCYSKYKGVTWDKRREKWIAQIQFDKRRYFLGYYDSEVEAALMYNQAALMRFGQFALINKIE